MMWRLAWRSLTSRPIRTAVLAAGFGFGIAVMAELLGVGHVMVEQAHAPALVGGGDLVVGSPFGSIQSARFLMSSVLASPDFKSRIAAASPSTDARLFLMTSSGAIAVSARGGIPSLEKAVGDPEVSPIGAWTDAPGDEHWTKPAAGDVLRAMDRFHPIPEGADHAASWAEWLYFNGRTRDGRLRLYLTFLVGPRTGPGLRAAGVRLQLERDGHSANYSASAQVDEAALLATAPDLEIGGNRVRLEGSSYRMTLALDGPQHLTGDLVLDGAPGRSVPPAAIRGARGWVSGYVVPVLSGSLHGTLLVAGTPLPLVDAAGYHDHNWGFWQGVTWQWGQVAHDDLSIVYGRVFPPADIADPQRVPGFLAVLGPGGPIGFSTDVTINDAALQQVAVAARGRAVDLHLTFSVGETVRTMMGLTTAPDAPTDFLQLGGMYHVAGHVGGRDVDFTARGAAETFRPHAPE